MIIQNDKIIDIWTPAHFLAGYFIGKTIKNRMLGLTIIVAVEIIENEILRKEFAQFFKEQELAPNIIADIITSWIGFELGLKS